MPNEEELLDEVVEVEDDSQEEVETEVEEADDEFERDEEGNIIIPDIVEEEPETEEEKESEPEEQPEEKEDEKPAEEPVKADESEELARLRKELFLLKSQSKDTLEKWGIKTDDVMEGLAKIAAEEEGLSVEEYKKQREEKVNKELEQQRLSAENRRRVMAQDLLELKQAFPELSNLTDISQIPNFEKFGSLRNLNLTAKEAYAASNPDALRKASATAANKQRLESTKSHLKSNVPSKSSDGGKPMMTRSELNEWRGYFPGKTDKEIIQLYRDTNN